MSDNVKRYTHMEMADLLQRPNFPMHEAVKRVRYLASGCGSGVSFLQSFGMTRGTGPTAPRVYPLSEVGKAGILINMLDAGINDHDALRTAEAGWLNHPAPSGMTKAQKAAWHKAHPKQPSEGERAIDAIAAGDTPLFLLTTYRNSSGGILRHAGVLITGATNEPEIPEGFVEINAFGIQLRPLLLPILIKIGIVKAN